MSFATPSPLGFIGLGTMGQPMALRLVKNGAQLLVWNRSLAKSRILESAGAEVAKEPSDVFQRCETIFLMLVDADAIDAVLARGTIQFEERVSGRTIINMATTSPMYSKALEWDIRNAGGRYVEAPVSGSRIPAENGQLVAMLAGSGAAVDEARPLLAPICRSTIICGPVPNALYMKLAVNLFLTAIVTGLAEAAHFAKRHNLDFEQFVAVLDGGPLASDVSRMKTAKLLTRDFTVQASIANVLANVGLIKSAARDAGVASPVLDACIALFNEANTMGLGDTDMISVIRAIESRSLPN